MRSIDRLVTYGVIEPEWLGDLQDSDLFLMILHETPTQAMQLQCDHSFLSYVSLSHFRGFLISKGPDRAAHGRHYLPMDEPLCKMGLIFISHIFFTVLAMQLKTGSFMSLIEFFWVEWHEQSSPNRDRFKLKIGLIQDGSRQIQERTGSVEEDLN